MKDEDARVVYGANCAWWDGIEKIGRIETTILGKPASLPCCPHCRGMLFEMPSPKDWWASVEKYQADGHPGYRGFVEWLKGKHFRTYDEAQSAYDAKPRPGVDRIKGVRP